MNKLSQIKQHLKLKEIDYYLVNKNNEYLNEFVEKEDNSLFSISNFTGSMGYGLISRNFQYLYIDGRYTQQAAIQSKNYKIKNIHFLKKDLMKLNKLKKKILIDPKKFSVNFFKNFNLKYFIFLSENKFQANKKEDIFFLKKKYSGANSDEKIKKVINFLKLKYDEGFLFTSPENIGWLTNIRSKDKKYSKIYNCYALLKNKKLYLYSSQKINFENQNIICQKLKEIEKTLINLSKIKIDPKYTSLFFLNLFKKNNVKISFADDPINKFKSIKNITEITNLKIAHIFDGVAYVKFLKWLYDNKLKKISEIDCQNKLEFFKKKNNFYLGPSFETISALNKNASIIHYNAKNYEKSFLKRNDMFLLDAGSQYLFGTTDMTRTISLGKQNKFRKTIYTLVLKGHIAVSTFKINKNTTGQIIDRSARKYLKQKNFDYEHGTGHGVGYLSNVHENPPTISKLSNNKFQINQVVSNEPGFYKKNDFGIRLENLIYLDKNKRFNNLTLVPFDNSLIVKSLLTSKEKRWLNNYHENVYEKINKFLNNNEKKFLRKICSKIN
jgi:Xaa-Pro aminopeptidase